MSHQNHYPTGKGHHEYHEAEPARDDLESSTYQEKEYEHQEYPKYVNGQLVNSAEEEARYSESAE
jgi:hypothetical protein